MIRFVDGLPSVAHPEVFGLHANADINLNLGQADVFLASLSASRQQGGAGSGGGGATALAATVKELLSRLPADFDVDAVAVKFPVSFSQSTNQVLLQEMAR